jgi:hypothetical protein
MLCSVPSVNATVMVYGPTMLNRVTWWMGCVMDLPEWVDLDGRLAGLQALPIMLQLGSVDLGPRLDEPLLRLW